MRYYNIFNISRTKVIAFVRIVPRHPVQASVHSLQCQHRDTIYNIYIYAYNVLKVLDCGTRRRRRNIFNHDRTHYGYNCIILSSIPVIRLRLFKCLPQCEGAYPGYRIPGYRVSCRSFSLSRILRSIYAIICLPLRQTLIFRGENYK